ncbi:MAG: thioredoxin domain-containing protein [Elusimicrobiota bacterium]
MKMNPLRLIPVMLLLAACAKKEPAFTAVNTELLAEVPERILANEVLTLKPAAEHHFEMQAPQKCADFPFELKTPRVMRCQVTAPGTHRLELSVCDDKRTYCKFVKFAATAEAPKGYAGSAAAKKSVLQPPTHAHPPLPGFIMNDTGKALTEAEAGGKLLFIDFYGIWCPPCNMLEEYVYKKRPFLDATKDMVRVMLDADSDLSWEWKAHFKVGGYPTIIIANEKLEEITRVVGYRPLGAMVRTVREAAAHKDEPIDRLLAAHEAGGADAAPSAARKRIGIWRHQRAEYAEAVKWLDGLADPEARKTALQAASSQASQEGDEKASLAAVRLLVREFPNDVEYASWVEVLLDKKDAGAAALLAPALKSLERWRRSPALDATGYTRTDMYWQEASLFQAAGDENAAKAVYIKTAELLQEVAARSDLKLARGANMERASCLHLAGKNAEAKALYEQLAETYGEEFTFNYNYASVLHKLEEYELAYARIRKAEAHAYGDNWLRTVYLKAKLELKLGKREQARTSVRAALREAVVPRSTAVRTHRYLANLRGLLREIDSPT